MSDSGEPALATTEPGSRVGPSVSGIIHQELQPQPPETTAVGEEQTSSAAPPARPVQPERRRQSIGQSAVTDDYNYVRMPYSEAPTAPERRSNVRLSYQ